jgi:hypothetical protein
MTESTDLKFKRLQKMDNMHGSLPYMYKRVEEIGMKNQLRGRSKLKNPFNLICIFLQEQDLTQIERFSLSQDRQKPSNCSPSD